ncbi:MAG: arsenosugar biosynthesis radical SAM protein ArsS [Phycisphaerae bacterium]|jgi:radical SAM/Cys-rich protein|nr:arsenosugar biosynthesis radical SAM protein ArsS [Phycisphaerae bacterium]
MNPFDEKLRGVGHFPLVAGDIKTVQVNVGLMCNLRCTHCHWSCGPGRAEMMDLATMQSVCRLAERTGARRVDITGGEPSLHPELRRFVELLAGGPWEIRLRTNFTGLLTEGNETLGEFLRAAGVQLVGSLPCYLDSNVDTQRGRGTYARSIECIRMLNSLGYARRGDLTLDLVYNPADAHLPPDQGQLERDYRRELREKFDIEFNSLLAITNMPIGRFAGELQNCGRDASYRRMLRSAFNVETLEALMCRNQICIGWDGTIADCDFNLALDRPASTPAPADLGDIDPVAMENRRIVTGEHCFACTAGKGSSCGGVLV